MLSAFVRLYVPIFLGTFALTLAQVVKADDSFEIDRGGQKYLCTPEATNPNASLDCVNTAYHGPFSQAEALQLCTGSNSIAPANCALSAYSGPFSKGQAIQLCTRAIDLGPVDCAKAAYSGPFSQDEALQLCSGRGELANAQCAIRAYAGPYTKAQAITLCRSNPNLMNVALAQLHNEAQLGFGVILEKANAKALKESSPVR